MLGACWVLGEVVFWHCTGTSVTGRIAETCARCEGNWLGRLQCVFSVVVVDLPQV